VRKNLGDRLSGGEKRRTEIARALATDPKFVLLDEPFAGVDPIAVEDIQAIVSELNKRNIGILITDHNVQETLSITDRAYLLFEGKIFSLSGLTKELFTRMNKVSNSGSYQGPHYFSFKEKKLNEYDNKLNYLLHHVQLQFDVHDYYIRKQVYLEILVYYFLLFSFFFSFFSGVQSSIIYLLGIKIILGSSSSLIKTSFSP
jgi:ABC-type multidrug transport system ATPase subunit